MRFEFATATRIIFGPGTLKEIGPLASTFGRRALVVTGRDTGRAKPLFEHLNKNRVDSRVFGVIGEPEVGTIGNGVEVARKAGCDMVLSFGGGSAIDAGKAIAAMLTNPGELLDYLEVIGRGKTLPNPSVPFIAIPTTAGTGSEVTRNAVLGSPSHRVKVSLRSAHLLPRVALVDPELTIHLPPAVTATTGLDAVTQLIEPYLSVRANPMTDALCLEGLRRAARSLRAACAHGEDRAAREDMCVASLFGGLALANAGLGAVHGFAGPIGGMFPAAHGAVCAVLLPHVMNANLLALSERQPASDALSRYENVARVLTGNSSANSADGVEWLRRLVKDLQVPALSAYGIGPEALDALAQKAMQASSMKANPLVLTEQELRRVLQDAL